MSQREELMLRVEALCREASEICSQNELIQAKLEFALVIHDHESDKLTSICCGSVGLPMLLAATANDLIQRQNGDREEPVH